MDALGVLAITAGIWLVYSGVTGIDALTTIQKIIANPAQASAIVAEAKGNVTPLSTGGSGTGDASYGSWGIVRGFKKHQTDGSASPGIDFKMPVGTPVPTPVSGLLTFAGPNAGGYGNLATIVTRSGYTWHFGHLSSFSGASNREVTVGTIIGLSGGVKGAVGSGNSSGPHLHIDVMNPQNQYVDPATFLFSKDPL